jgi:uncharacterized membrane-anchored protein
MTRTISAPADSPSNEAFFWATATLAQTFGSASADWIIDPGGPGCGRALIAITLGILATIGLYAYTRISRAVLFWIAFTLSGTGAALGGHIIANSFVATQCGVGSNRQSSSTCLSTQLSTLSASSLRVALR